MAATASTLARQDATPEKVAKLTAASSLAGALLTAVYESTVGRARALREREAAAPSATQAAPNVRLNGAKPYRHPTALLSASAALNSGMVGLCFFSLREYVVSPALAGSLSDQGEGGRGTSESAALTWSAMRMRHVPDTALTSALLGGAFNAWKRGLTAVPSGAFTAALACTALQFLTNEIGVQRIRFVSARQTHSSPQATVSPSQSDAEPPTVSSSMPISAVPSSSATAAAAPAKLNDSGAEPEPAGPSFGERILGLLGFTRLPDEEYLSRLKAKREKHLARIRELEEMLDEERRGSEENGGEEKR